MGMRTEIIQLTPELAQDLLDTAAANRNTSTKTVDAYKRDITEDRWTLNGESVKVNTAGKMFDGKHRCMAVVAAKKPITTIIVWDADEENVDAGRPRTYGDQLAIHGHQNARNLAAALTATTNWLRGYPPGFTANFKLTAAELDKTLISFPEIQESVRAAQAHRSSIPMSPAMLSLCHWLFTSTNPDDAGDFFRDTAKGAGLNEGNPALTLRNRLIKDRITRRGGLDPKDSSALMIMAWNARQEGRPLIKLQLPTPLTIFKFPIPTGWRKAGFTLAAARDGKIGITSHAAQI